MTVMTAKLDSENIQDDCDMVTSLDAVNLSKAELYLHEAARKNEVDLIAKIVSQNLADVNTKNNLDRTALHIAASQGHKDACAKLIQFKAIVDAADKYGMTPILWASYFNHKDVVELLLSKNAKGLRRNKHGMHCLHIAAERNHDELFNELVKMLKAENHLNDVENNGRTALMLAAANGSLLIVKNLLQRTECDVIREDKMKKNALHHAAQSGHIEILKLLLDTNLVEKINQNDAEARMNPLHYTCQLGHVGAVKKLLEKNVDVNKETDDEKQHAPIHLATIAENVDIVKMLSQNPNCNINAQNCHGNTALHLAALTDNARLIDALLEAKCEIDMPNNRMQTALHVSVERNMLFSTETLLQAGANLTVTDKSGKTPLLLATRGSYIGLVDMIIESERKRRQMPNFLRFSNEPPTNGKHLFSPTELNGQFRPADFNNVYNIHTEIDVDSSDNADEARFRLKEFNQEYAEEFKLYLWKLAFKHLRSNEWRTLGLYWNFSEDHLQAIEHQFTGKQSYKQHGYRLLCIWFHGIDHLDAPLRELYAALVAIGRKELAEKMRRDLDVTNHKHNKKKCTVT